MRSGTMFFYLILNTTGKTSWDHEDKAYWNKRYDEMLSEIKGLRSINDDGHFTSLKYCCELEKNRIKVECMYTIYDKMTYGLSELFRNFKQEIREGVNSKFKKEKATLVNTFIFWHNADTIIFDDELMEGSMYRLKAIRVDSAEADYLLNKLY